MGIRTVVAAVSMLVVAAAWPQQPVNIALGKSYQLSPRPNYSYCTDPGDRTQLTDGVYTQGYFWTQKTTVGWTRGGFKHIVIDLGDVKPICGLSFNTAAGVAGVFWPRAILIFVSDDGKKWHLVGDLVAMVPKGLLPPYGKYAVRKLSTTDLKTHGRYVRLVVAPGGSYCFVDEIEVYEGPKEYLRLALPGEAITDVPKYLLTATFNMLIAGQLRSDLATVRKDIAGAGLPADRQHDLLAKADALEKSIKGMPTISPKGFKAILPMTDLERKIFELQAEVWRAQGKPALRVWKCHRWDYLAPSAEPAEDGEEAKVSVRMMNGEVRADVVNFTNAGPREIVLRLTITGLPGAPNPDYITVRRTLHVGTRNYDKPVSAALVEAERRGSEYLVPVPSGMTGQVWLEFHPREVKPGAYRGSLVVKGGAEPIAVPVRLYISRLRFPQRQSLLIGGWSYTDGKGTYGVTAQNWDALIRYLREHGVNAPWATSASMPEGKFDEAGNLVQKPDTSRFDEWVGKWWGSRMYMVFLAKGTTFAGAEMGTPEFAVRVGKWAKFWADHIRSLGLQPSQLGFLIHDEPHEARGYRINAEWAKAIQAAEPELVLFVDPTPATPKGMDEMIQQMDILCPNRIHWLTRDWLAPYYAQWQKKGKQLWLYSCSGPTRSFDPYCYYLLQEWLCFSVGAKGSCFWAFGDTGRVDCWNDYVGSGAGPYCPMYIDPTSVTTAKWMEAIREGAEDYEYLTMLRRRVEEAGGGGDLVVRARRLLEQGPARVLRAHGDKAGIGWSRDVDRSVADRVRWQVLSLLEKL